jgi:hypothetical protein
VLSVKRGARAGGQACAKPDSQQASQAQSSTTHASQAGMSVRRQRQKRGHRPGCWQLAQPRRSMPPKVYALDRPDATSCVARACVCRGGGAQQQHAPG